MGVVGCAAHARGPRLRLARSVRCWSALCRWRGALGLDWAAAAGGAAALLLVLLAAALPLRRPGTGHAAWPSCRAAHRVSDADMRTLTLYGELGNATCVRRCWRSHAAASCGRQRRGHGRCGQRRGAGTPLRPARPCSRRGTSSLSGYPLDGGRAALSRVEILAKRPLVERSMSMIASGVVSLKPMERVADLSIIAHVDHGQVHAGQPLHSALQRPHRARGIEDRGARTR